jgi:biopolymer transport protein ExbD
MSKPVIKSRSTADFDLARVEKTETVHHVSAKERRKKQTAQVGQLNLTSMMDVVFQLLIFFVLTAQFVIDEGIIPADLPQGQATPTESVELPKEPLIIFLRSAGDNCVISIEGTPPMQGDFQALFDRLNAWRLDTQNPNGVYLPDNPLVIRPQGKVRWKDVVNAFNQCVRAKYIRVSFAEAAPGGR